MQKFPNLIIEFMNIMEGEGGGHENVTSYLIRMYLNFNLDRSQFYN